MMGMPSHVPPPCVIFAGLFKMLYELSPTLREDYYPGVRDLPKIKADADAKSAAAGPGAAVEVRMAKP